MADRTSGPHRERSSGSPRRVLVTGAGPVGLLAALLAVQRGYDTHVLDVVCWARSPSSGVCLVGLSSGARAAPVDVGDLTRRLVLDNDIVCSAR